MAYVLGILVLLVILAVSIGLHEYGHLFAARKLGLKVPKFFVGFGPTIYSRTSKAGNEYGLKLLPIGGFVSVVDPNHKPLVQEAVPEGFSESSRKKGTRKSKAESDRELHGLMLSNVHPLRRIIVFLAGPLVNIALAFLILIPVFWTTPTTEPMLTVETVNSCVEGGPCGADQAGLQPGDEIIAVNGASVESTSDVTPHVANGQTSVDFTVLRSGVETEVPGIQITEGLVGLHYVTERQPRTFTESVNSTVSLVNNSLETIASIPPRIASTVGIIFGAERDEDSLASVITMGTIYSEISSATHLEFEDKISLFLFYGGVLNLGLGFINLLPILPLDGGRILIASMDWVKKAFARVRKTKYRPVGADMIVSMMVVGTSIVAGCMALIVLADIVSPVDVSRLF